MYKHFLKISPRINLDNLAEILLQQKKKQSGKQHFFAVANMGKLAACSKLKKKKNNKSYQNYFCGEKHTQNTQKTAKF